MRSLLAVTGVLVLSGCAADPDAFDAIDPGALSRASAGTVRCSADEGGNLHVRAPPDARVSVPPDATNGDATAEIAYASADDYQMPRPQRAASRSLGFIGDAPLTQGPNYGGRYSYGAHDNLLPPHVHITGGRARYRGGYGYRSFGGYSFDPRWR